MASSNFNHYRSLKGMKVIGIVFIIMALAIIAAPAQKLEDSWLPITVLGLLGVLQIGISSFLLSKLRVVHLSEDKIIVEESETKELKWEEVEELDKLWFTFLTPIYKIRFKGDSESTLFYTDKGWQYNDNDPLDLQYEFKSRMAALIKRKKQVLKI